MLTLETGLKAGRLGERIGKRGFERARFGLLFEQRIFGCGDLRRSGVDLPGHACRLGARGAGSVFDLLEFGGGTGQCAFLALPLGARGFKTGLHRGERAAFLFKVGIECACLRERVGQQALVGLDRALPRLDVSLRLLQTQPGLLLFIAGAGGRCLCFRLRCQGFGLRHPCRRLRGLGFGARCCGALERGLGPLLRLLHGGFEADLFDSGVGQTLIRFGPAGAGGANLTLDAGALRLLVREVVCQQFLGAASAL